MPGLNLGVPAGARHPGLAGDGPIRGISWLAGWLPPREWRGVLLLLLGGILPLHGLCFATSRCLPLNDSVIHGMAASRLHWGQDFVLPPYPPLVYCVGVPVTWAFGLDKWSLFLVQALFALVMILATERIGTRLWNPEVGFVAGVLLAFSIPMGFALRSYLLDMPLGAVWTLQFLCYLKSEGFTRKTYSWLFALLIPIGMWTKYPYLPLVAGPFLAWTLLRLGTRIVREPQERAGGVGLLKGLFLNLGIGLLAWLFLGPSGACLVFSLSSFLMALHLLRRPQSPGAESLTRFLFPSCAALGLGAVWYVSHLPDLLRMGGVNILLRVDSPAGLWGLLERFLVFFSGVYLLPILAGMVFIGVLLTLLDPESRRRNGEILGAVVFPSVLLTVLLTDGRTRFFAPILAFLCLLAAFWLPRLGEALSRFRMAFLRWVPVSLLVLGGILFSGGWRIPGLVPLQDPFVIGRELGLGSVTRKTGILAGLLAGRSPELGERSWWPPADSNLLMWSSIPPMQAEWTEIACQDLETLFSKVPATILVCCPPGEFLESGALRDQFNHHLLVLGQVRIRAVELDLPRPGQPLNVPVEPGWERFPPYLLALGPVSRPEFFPDMEDRLAHGLGCTSQLLDERISQEGVVVRLYRLEPSPTTARAGPVRPAPPRSQER